MKWRTAINVHSELKMSYDDDFIFMGSCFSENIAQRMKTYGFHVLMNPFGIMYNPVSLFRSLSILTGQETLRDTMFLQAKDSVFHYDLHSQFFGKDRNELEKRCNNPLDGFSEYLEEGSKASRTLNIFITLGTAWVYRHKESDRVVANCHKQAAHLFEKELLTEQTILDQLNKLANLNFSRATNIIFTVSPIRHIKDGIHENQVSKSRLLSAVYSVVQQNPMIHYFPAYEIMMDDLRDYRFYKADLLHPNAVAIDYIWEKFQASSLTNKTKQIILEYVKLIQMKNHKLMFPESEESKKFMQSLESKLQQFYLKYPSVLSS